MKRSLIDTMVNYINVISLTWKTNQLSFYIYMLHIMHVIPKYLLKLYGIMKLFY